MFELATERARYEADRAQPQFDNVEPENRLVARTLETTLETKLAAVRAAENNLAAQRARRPVALTEQELAWITTAGADVRAVFEAPTTTLRERKQLIRAVIAEVAITVRAEERVAQLRILWQGGAATDVSMPMTKPGWHLRVTNEATVALVRRLAEHYDDRTIAAILAKQKRRTATGCSSTVARTTPKHLLRSSNQIQNRPWYACSPAGERPRSRDFRPRISGTSDSGHLAIAAGSVKNPDLTMRRITSHYENVDTDSIPR